MIINKGSTRLVNSQNMVLRLILLKRRIDFKPWTPYKLNVMIKAAMEPPYWFIKLLWLSPASGKSKEKLGSEICSNSTTIGLSTWEIKIVKTTNARIGYFLMNLLLAIRCVGLGGQHNVQPSGLFSYILSLTSVLCCAYRWAIGISDTLPLPNCQWQYPLFEPDEPLLYREDCTAPSHSDWVHASRVFAFFLWAFISSVLSHFTGRSDNIWVNHSFIDRM